MIQTARIRRMTLEDVPSVLILVKTLADHHDDIPTLTEESLARDCLGDHPWVTVLVAETSDGVVAYTALCPLAQLQFAVRGMDMHHLCVARNYRGRGIGGALIDAAKREARDQGCAYMMVGTHPDNLDAQAVYLHAGFEAMPVASPRFRIKL